MMGAGRGKNSAPFLSDDSNHLRDATESLESVSIQPFLVTSEGCDNRDAKIHVYRKRQKSDSSWEFLRIENKQIKTVPSYSYG